MKDAEKFGHMLSRLGEISLEEGLEMELDDPTFYSPSQELVVPDIHTIKSYSIFPNKIRRKHPSVDVEYSAIISFTRRALDMWYKYVSDMLKEDRSKIDITIEDAIRMFNPVTLSHIKVGLNMWYNEDLDDGVRRYLIGSDGVVFHSFQPLPEYRWGYPEIPYRNFTGKHYETMFRDILRDFKNPLLSKISKS